MCTMSFFVFPEGKWIGWTKEATPVKIGFQFDQLRKFSTVAIHVNNFVSQGAQVKKTIEHVITLEYLSSIQRFLIIVKTLEGRENRKKWQH